MLAVKPVDPKATPTPIQAQKDANPQGGLSTITPVVNTVKLGSHLPFTCQTIADFFFADETGSLPDLLNMKEVNLIYKDYIAIMQAVH